MARRSISNRQKLALREQRRLRPEASNLALQRWFEETYHRTISTSSVCEILGNRFKHLEAIEATEATEVRSRVQSRPNETKNRPTKWPDLEYALAQWCRYTEQDITLTGLILRTKAEHFWKHLPQYQSLPMPTFSNGWLEGFQKRTDIRYRKRYGEAYDVPIAAETEMIRIRRVLKGYKMQDIFNCDESGLFWKRIPDKSLCSRSLPGQQKEKARITAHFTCNADGSEKLPIWFIGKAKKPRAFTAAGVNMNHFNMVWRSNEKAWMTGTLFAEYLRWFDNKMANRNVILLMDNFPAHELGVQMIEESNHPLQNTTIICLPPNSTSKYQPLDQGIINTWKTYWRRYWVRFILTEFEEGRTPLMTMNVLQAIRWGIQVWEVNITATTITSCFQKGLNSSDTLQQSAILLGTPIPATPEPELKQEIQHTLDQLQQAQHILEVEDLTTFINPPEETITADSDDLEEHIIAQFTHEEEEDSDEEVIHEPPITASQALESLRTLRLWEEQRGGNITLISQLNAEELQISAQKVQNMRQGDIRVFFQ